MAANRCRSVGGAQMLRKTARKGVLSGTALLAVRSAAARRLAYLGERMSPLDRAAIR